MFVDTPVVTKTLVWGLKAKALNALSCTNKDDWLTNAILKISLLPVSTTLTNSA